MKTREIFFERISEFAKLPERGSKGAAGWDLFSAERKVIEPFKPTLVSLGFKIAIPKDTQLQVLPRGGRSFKTNTLIANSPGLVDEDYRGEMFVIVIFIPRLKPNTSEKFVINVGEKIAQCVLTDYHVQNWNVVDKIMNDTERGEGNLGSTDKGTGVGSKLTEVIVEQLGVDKKRVTLSANFIDDLGAVSLDVVELIMSLEEEFDVEIEDEEAEKIKTVGEAQAALKAKGVIDS